MTIKSTLNNNIIGTKPVPNIVISDYKKSDFEFVEKLQAKAFGPARFVRAAFRVRERFPIDESLGLIAKIDGQRVGSVSMTPISIAKINGYLLGPLVTDKDYRGLGIGRKLVIEASKNALKANGEFVILVGDLSYYSEMGFRQANLGSIKFPAPVNEKRILVHCKDEDLIDKLNGELAAFI